MSYRYDLGSYPSREKAESVLEHMFADGEICEGERPEIEKRSGRTRTGASLRTRYVITAADSSYRTDQLPAFLIAAE